MAISRPFLLALLGVLLLGVTVIAVQSARTGADSDSTPAAVQSEPAPAQPTAARTPADTLTSAVSLNDLESAKFTAKLSFGNGRQSVGFDVDGAFERGAANDIPKFDVDARISVGNQRVVGGFISLGDKAFFTRGDTGWRLPAAIWDPVVEAVAKGGPAQPLDIEPASWVRDVKSEGTDTIDGVESEHISAAVDPKAVVRDLTRAARQNGASLSSRELDGAIKRADLDVWVGADDRILRRLSGAVVFAGGGRISVDLRLSDVNEPQQIEAPANVRAGAPGGVFGQFAEGIVGGISGGSSLKVLTSPNPRRAARAVRDHRKVVILFRNPRGLDDRAMRSVMHAVDSRTKALVLTDHVDAVERYGKLVEDLGVSQTPSVVIIDRSGEARLIEGYVDSDTLAQAVSDAR